jgi:hypothetical protein
MGMSEHFIILGLPRSMTAWVSCFMTCGDAFCQHELSGQFQGQDLIARISQPFPVSGICDSVLISVLSDANLLKSNLPFAKYVWIERPISDCVESFCKATGVEKEKAEEIIYEIQCVTGFFLDTVDCETFTFDELQTEEGARRLWEYCAPSVPLPPAHLKKMMSLKVVQHPKVYQEAAKLLNSLN